VPSRYLFRVYARAQTGIGANVPLGSDQLDYFSQASKLGPLVCALLVLKRAQIGTNVPYLLGI
jgi:hypothetical protein